MKLGIFGTKMRSVINLASKQGIAAIAKQQFDVAAQIAGHGLMPIIEPEVSINSPDKAGAEEILLAEITKNLDALPTGRQVMLKLTIPDVPDLYSALVNDKRVARVVALSGGYTRADACKRLGRESRHHRKLLARPGRRPPAFDERCRIQRGTGKIHRRDLSGLDREGLMRRRLAGPASKGVPESPRRVAPQP